MHKVEFLTKNIQEDDPNYQVVTDRSKEFETFCGAMSFIRSLKGKTSSREIIIGKPALTEFG